MSTKPKLASLEFTYRRLETTSELHRYELIATLRLNEPPTQDFRLRLLWPQQVRITQSKGLNEGDEEMRDLGKGRFKYKELWLDGDAPIFPGQSVQIIGPNRRASLTYEYDDETYELMRIYKAPLIYTLYLRDYMPMEGSIPFTKLEGF